MSSDQQPVMFLDVKCYSPRDLVQHQQSAVAWMNLVRSTMQMSKFGDTLDEMLTTYRDAAKDVGPSSAEVMQMVYDLSGINLPFLEIVQEVSEALEIARAIRKDKRIQIPISC